MGRSSAFTVESMSTSANQANNCAAASTVQIHCLQRHRSCDPPGRKPWRQYRSPGYAESPAAALLPQCWQNMQTVIPLYMMVQIMFSETKSLKSLFGPPMATEMKTQTKFGFAKPAVRIGHIKAKVDFGCCRTCMSSTMLVTNVSAAISRGQTSLSPAELAPLCYNNALGTSLLWPKSAARQNRLTLPHHPILG